MPSLPRKARNGDDFKSYTTSAINKLIDYLHSMRPKDSPDIKVKESASGVMFELANRPKMTPQVASTGGGGTTYGIEATIDGSTASVALVEGGTASSVSIVPTAPITLSVGANGELIIGSTASGGGFGAPNYADDNQVAVPFGTSTSVAYDGWIVGYIAYDYDSYGVHYQIEVGLHTFIIGYAWSQNTDFLQYTSVCIPVPANMPFQLNGSGGNYLVGNQLFLVHTL